MTASPAKCQLAGNDRKMWVIFVQITPHRVVYAKKQVDSAHFRNRRDKMYIVTKCTHEIGCENLCERSSGRVTSFTPTVTRRDKMQVTIMLLLIINVEAVVVKCHGRKRKENVANISVNIFICMD